MVNNSNLSIVSSFLGLWIASFFSKEYQIVIGFVLIFSFGILHGANDILLIEKVNKKNRRLSFVKILINYILFVIAGAIFFYLLSGLALALFILVSAYHFGEQHWQKIQKNFKKWLVMLFQFSYGIFILSLLFNFNAQEVKLVVFEITRISITAKYTMLLLIISSISLVSIGSFFYWKSIEFRKIIITEIFYILVFAVIFNTSSLIWGFTIYFISWHSIPSIVDQVTFLYGRFTFDNFISYFKSALFYWISSLIGIAILYYLFKDEKIFNAIFFSFLAAITFPHALVILKMFDNETEQEEASKK